MKSSLFFQTSFLASFLLFLFFLSCQSVTDGGEASLNDSLEVQLAEEKDLPIQWLEASFLSVKGDFSYTFKYNAYLLQLLDIPAEGPLDYGPHFQVEGGATIKGRTVLLSELDLSSSLTSVQILGGHRVLRTAFEEGDCTVHKTATEYRDEALTLELKICSGNNKVYGLKALESLYEGLSLTML